MVKKTKQASRPPKIKSERIKTSKVEAAHHFDQSRTFLYVDWSQKSLTLGFPFALVLVAFVLCVTKWDNMNGHTDVVGTIFVGSVGTAITTCVRNLWKR